MLILLPASVTKNPVRRGRPIETAALSFAPLAPTRTAVLEALIDVSARPNAIVRLGERPSFSDVVRRNVALRGAPTAEAANVYAGVLYDALGLPDLDAASRRRARAWIVIISALWGAIRPSDRIPPYRLDMCGRLPGLGHLPDVWRRPLAKVLPSAAGGGVVVDLRSSEYASAWRPTGALAERTVVVKVVRDGPDGTRGAASHSAKHTRGLVVRRIVTDAVDPSGPEGLADALSEHFKVDLRAPERPFRSWELQVVEPAAG